MQRIRNPLYIPLGYSRNNDVQYAKTNEVPNERHRGAGHPRSLAISFVGVSVYRAASLSMVPQRAQQVGPPRDPIAVHRMQRGHVVAAFLQVLQPVALEDDHCDARPLKINGAQRSDALPLDVD